MQDNEIRLLSEQKNVFSDVKKINSEAEILRTYTAVLNGFATEVSYKDIEALKENPLVKNVSLSRQYEIPALPRGDESSNEMIYSDVAWDVGYKGEGMLIAVIDSGIDYNHPLLNSLDSENKITKEEMDSRVQNANSLNAKGSSYYINDKVVFGYDYGDDDEDPMGNENGHGTHVAGIAAANEGEGTLMKVKGVAPNAQIMAMKAHYLLPVRKMLLLCLVLLMQALFRRKHLILNFVIPTQTFHLFPKLLMVKL